MKTLHVTIRLGVGVDDDGAFDKFDARALQWALCRAFPLCRGEAIEVEEIGALGGLVPAQALGDFSVDFLRERDRVDLGALEPGTGRRVAILSLSNQDACLLGAWLVWAAGESEHMNAGEAIEYFMRSYVDGRRFGRGEK